MVEHNHIKQENQYFHDQETKANFIVVTNLAWVASIPVQRAFPHSDRA